MKKATNIKNGNVNIKCEYCGGCGYHKMSCPTQKVTIWFDKDSLDKMYESIDKELANTFIPTLEGDETAIFFPDENSEQKDISKMETTESGSSEIPNNQADRKIGNSDFVICNRVNRTDNSRCVNCGAKTGHPCQMKPNESNYC